MTLQRLRTLLDQRTIANVWDFHCQTMAGFGFDRLLYGYTRFANETCFGDPKDALILSNHDPAYLERYLSEDHLRNAPMVRWARNNDGYCAWPNMQDDTPCKSSAPDLCQVLSTNREFGVLCGYTISFRALSPGGFGAIGLTGASGMTQGDLDALWADKGDEIVLMNEVMHLAVMNLPAADENRLTKRQREVLEWVASGKTIPEICGLIDRKQATVEKHLRLAREAMGAQTTAQAVLKASFQRQIFSNPFINDIDFTNR